MGTTNAAPPAIGVAEVGKLCTVLHLALIGLCQPFGSRHQYIIRPQLL